jgi:hypothetical protein
VVAEVDIVFDYTTHTPPTDMRNSTDDSLSWDCKAAARLMKTVQVRSQCCRSL